MPLARLPVTVAAFYYVLTVHILIVVAWPATGLFNVAGGVELISGVWIHWRLRYWQMFWLPRAKLLYNLYHDIQYNHYDFRLDDILNNLLSLQYKMYHIIFNWMTIHASVITFCIKKMMCIRSITVIISTILFSFVWRIWYVANPWYVVIVINATKININNLLFIFWFSQLKYYPTFQILLSQYISPYMFGVLQELRECTGISINNQYAVADYL